jgi:uncharacterized protein YprB with RNaseH-like and TPR domain
VSVSADASGLARVWRRTPGGGVATTEHRFPNWFLATDLELVGHMTVGRIAPAALGGAGGQLADVGALGVVELEDEPVDAYRFLVLTERLAEVEAAVLDTYNKRVSGQLQSLAELRGLVLVLPPVEQFLVLTGRTYFKGLGYDDLVRLQFDLETTGLDEQRDRIFMISMRDNRGWRTCLDISAMSEQALLGRFVDLIRERDPDVLENHNIFAFDLPFLVKRAASLGVHLGLGRDGSAPRPRADVFRAGDRSEPFTRWQVTGREVVDTQHAVRRYASETPDMRLHGLKQAARYFGIARPDREYVVGAEIWSTYRQDPERIRRYANDDVDEVDGLSRRLLPELFALATMVPRAYERIVADASARALIEPVLLRTYVRTGHAVPAPLSQAAETGSRPSGDLLVRGVVRDVVLLSLSPLLAAILGNDGMRAANDRLAALPRLVIAWLACSAEPEHQDAAPARAACQRLADAAPAYLAAGGWLWSDTGAAARLDARARAVVDGVIAELRREGATVVEVDGQRVMLAVPPGWSDVHEHRFESTVRRLAPDGVRLIWLGRYSGAYTRSEGSHILVADDGRVVVRGAAFRIGKREHYGEHFVRALAPLVVLGDPVGVRRLFLATVAELRAERTPIEDLCVQQTLHKAVADYRRAGYREEPYEVLLAAGVKTWRPGVRVRYYRDRTGGLRLLQEGEPAAPDWEYYVQRLRTVYCQHYAAAYGPDDFARLFRLPRADANGRIDDPADEAEIASISTIAEPVLKTLPMEGAGSGQGGAGSV